MSNIPEIGFVVFFALFLVPIVARLVCFVVVQVTLMIYATIMWLVYKFTGKDTKNLYYKLFR